MNARSPQPPLPGGSLHARCTRLSRGAPHESSRRCSLRERGVLPWGGPAARLDRQLLVPLLALALAACGGQPPRPVIDRAEVPAAAPPAASAASVARKPGAPQKFGGGYKDDGPGEGAPDIDAIPDAVPRDEPLHRFANNPYSALGRDYVPLRTVGNYRGRGIGSWYGRRYHGQRTSSGEAYDMYAMTAAHPTLPIPSYARVTNVANGRSVVVRINDRGPFLAGREIDLSWTAAAKLGYVGAGSATVEVESLAPGREPAVAAAPAPRPGPPAAAEDPIAKMAATEPEPSLPQVQDARGHFLQLGAFGNRDNAEALRARLARELGDLAGKLVIQPAGKVFRVQLGPWADAAAAQQAGGRLRESLGMTPVVVQR